MSYNRHRNPNLIMAYQKDPMPYQGANPSQARCLFFGLDAKFDEHIENSEIFPDVLNYLCDGPRFWRKHLRHHPFLLDNYTGGGRYYHESFARIAFTTAHADCVSFVELLPFPTYGRSNLTPNDLQTQEIQEHLQKLNEIIICGNQRVFIPSTVGTLLRHSSPYFSWLPNNPAPDPDGDLVHLKRWHNNVRECVYQHTFFSRWDRVSEEAKRNECPEIRKLCIV
jgi:hypothetical protein